MMTNALLIADAAALSAPIVFVSLATVVALLGVRAVTDVTGVPLSRSVSRMLDIAILVLFLLFLVLVVLRFKVIG